MSDSLQQAQLWLAQEWAGRLAAAVEAITGESPQIMCEQADALVESFADPDRFWWRQCFSFFAEPTIWIGAKRATCREIGNRGLAGGDAQREYEEILTHSLSGLAQTISGRLRKEVICSEGVEGRPSGRAMPAFGVTLMLGVEEFELNVVLNSNLAAMLLAPAQVPPALAAAADPSKTIDLLLDVELPVSVSFGRAQLPLKEVIKLTTGSIVELNRTVQEPVEIIVNNCVIARGQVVVLEGNFGIRIQEVVSRQERLRTLK